MLVLVEPAGAINLGSVARLCANFGVDELRLVNPSCNPNDLDAQKMAVKGKVFLSQPKKFRTLLEAIQDCDRVIATCGRLDHGEIPLEPTEQALTWLNQNPTSNPIAIVFGREDRGLTNQEIQLANKVITLKSSNSYPSLNLSHAVAIVLYEIKRKEKVKGPKKRKNVSQDEFERLVDRIMDLLENSSYPERRLDRSKTTLRRLISRGNPDEGEYENLMGIFKAIKEGKR